MFRNTEIQSSSCSGPPVDLHLLSALQGSLSHLQADSPAFSPHYLAPDILFYRLATSGSWHYFLCTIHTHTMGALGQRWHLDTIWHNKDHTGGKSTPYHVPNLQFLSCWFTSLYAIFQSCSALLLYSKNVIMIRLSYQHRAWVSCLAIKCTKSASMLLWDKVSRKEPADTGTREKENCNMEFNETGLNLAFQHLVLQLASGKHSESHPWRNFVHFQLAGPPPVW